MTVEIYSDIACPWCYIGERRFSRALSAFPQAEQVDVVFRPYQLDPSLPETPRPLKDQLKNKFGPRLDDVLHQTAATAKQEGLDLQFEEAQAVNTLTAHRLLRFAEREAGAETQRALAEKLFEAHFTNGQNVADTELLADLAASVGLDRDRVQEYLISDAGRSEVQETIARAQRLGIRAVPTFVFNGEQALQGAQPPSAFLEVLEGMQREADADSADETPADACGDGACSI